jgi:hypothetical protein
MCPAFTPRDERNYNNFIRWMTVSMFTFAAATILIDRGTLPAAAGWSLTVITVALLIAAVHSYTIFLRGADELIRKIHLDALAVAFGAGIVTMMGWRLCERLGAPKLDVNDASLVMLLVWIGWQFLGMRRYAGGEE